MKKSLSNYRIDFDALDWERPAEGVRFKIARSGETQVRLVEFTQELSHPEWCTVGHSGYILEGILEVSFGGDIVEFAAGDGVLIPEGDAHKHIPRAVSDMVRFISVEKI